jgi:hypothetical protein
MLNLDPKVIELLSVIKEELAWIFMLIFCFLIFTIIHEIKKDFLK